MNARRILFFCVMYFVNFQAGNTSKAISKIDFNDESAEFKQSYVETFDTSDSEEKSDKAELKDHKSDIVCNNKKCVFTFDDGDTVPGDKKISTDVHVRISTNIKDAPESKAEDKEDDVPIFLGYAGVDSKDINFDNVDINGKPKQPADIQVPSLILEPPKYEPHNWHDYLTWKEKATSTTTKRPQYPNGFYPYNIAQSGENVIPPGWSSGWKPVAAVPSPDDYHYNINRKEDGFYGMNPHFVTYCSCTRKPAYAPKPTYHLYPRSWLHYETTTKLPLDGKLTPPFRADGKNKKTV